MSKKFVLVGSSDPALATMLRDAMGEVPRPLPLERFGDLCHVDTGAPEIVALDLRDKPQLPSALSTLKRVHPDTDIVVIARSLDPTMMLEAMRLGVNEFLADPVTEPDVKAAVARILAKRESGKAGQVLAFVGAKGGVGTTTLAVNVATTVSMLSSGHTLLMDLHMMSGDAGVFLGAEPRFSVIDALENSHRLDETFFKSLVVRTKSGLELLASSDRVIGTLFEPARVRALVEFVTRHYRFVVLDVPRLDPVALDSLEAASSIVVVTSQEVASVRSAARMSNALVQRYGREKVRVVVARVNPIAEIEREDIEKALGTGIRHEIPSDYRLAIQALNTGKPLALENHNELSSSIHALARELAGISVDKHAQDRKAGLFGRLTGRRH